MALTNDIRLIGHCGIAPKILNYGHTRKFCRLPIYTEHWVRHSDGGYQRLKELHWCLFFGKLAERAEKILLKGAMVHIRGTLHYHKFEKNGHKEIKPQILVDDFMISTQPLMTKEVYRLIYEEQVESKNGN